MCYPIKTVAHLCQLFQLSILEKKDVSAISQHFNSTRYINKCFFWFRGKPVLLTAQHPEQNWGLGVALSSQPDSGIFVRCQ